MNLGRDVCFHVVFAGQILWRQAFRGQDSQVWLDLKVFLDSLHMVLQSSCSFRKRVFFQDGDRTLRRSPPCKRNWRSASPSIPKDKEIIKKNIDLVTIERIYQLYTRHRLVTKIKALQGIKPQGFRGELFDCCVLNYYTCPFASNKSGFAYFQLQKKES